eukprot:TRINITY_DN2735_c0_g1_i1.p1 TRINITY_DN2735_c0_g1~~TRINITY_DN2735_c0_g1_i1.p1  ORF type:complete len:180 (-),score=26.32 TRINITY_DN2735_c0_g1_i1:35-574(-)
MRTVFIVSSFALLVWIIAIFCPWYATNSDVLTSTSNCFIDGICTFGSTTFAANGRGVFTGTAFFFSIGLIVWLVFVALQVVHEFAFERLKIIPHLDHEYAGLLLPAIAFFCSFLALLIFSIGITAEYGSFWDRSNVAGIVTVSGPSAGWYFCVLNLMIKTACLYLVYGETNFYGSASTN